MGNKSRRSFMKHISAGALGSAFIPELIKRAEENEAQEWMIRNKKFSANDQINIAVIGAGGMGLADTNTAITVSGVKMVAACDLYDGRLEDAKRIYGKDIFTTRDFREVLSRKDIDAVIIATPDHWHKDISVAAMDSGKSVYCEKPMTQNVSEGSAVVDAQNRNKVVFQVGSQGVSSLGNEKQRSFWLPERLAS